MDTSKLSSNRFDNTSMLSMAKTNRTVDKLLPKHKKTTNDLDLKLNVRKDKPRVSEILDESVMEDPAKYLVSEELKVITPYDFGYFTLFHTGNEDLQLEILKMQEEGPDAFDSNNFKKVLYLVTAIAPKK